MKLIFTIIFLLNVQFGFSQELNIPIRLTINLFGVADSCIKLNKKYTLKSNIFLNKRKSILSPKIKQQLDNYFSLVHIYDSLIRIVIFVHDNAYSDTDGHLFSSFLDPSYYGAKILRSNLDNKLVTHIYSCSCLHLISDSEQKINNPNDRVEIVFYKDTFKDEYKANEIKTE